MSSKLLHGGNNDCGMCVRKTGLLQFEETNVAIATYTAVCALVFGLLAFSFYKLMEPTRLPNFGLLAYKPPPATVVTYPPEALSDVTRATLPPAAGPPPDEPALETVARAIPSAEPTDLASMAAAPPVQIPRAAKSGRPRARKPATARTVSPRAQPPSGGFMAAYPGYAAVQ
jgi:hypothetical protein